MTLETITPPAARGFAPAVRGGRRADAPRLSPASLVGGGDSPAWRADADALARVSPVTTLQTAQTATLKRAQLKVTRMASDRGIGRTAPFPVENAYMVALLLRDCPGAGLRKLGAPWPAEPFVAGSIVIAHLGDEPCFDLPGPFDLLLFHIPRIVFGELADDHGAPRVGSLAEQASVADPIVHHLGRALLPWLDAPSADQRRFFDHVAFAVHSRLASRYGLTDAAPATRVGALTPWQERVAKEALIARFPEEPVLADVAQACGLPVGRLVRAFRETTGAPPYRWLRSYRVERAQDLLLNSALSLAQVAYDCGFADQSHFTRVFTAAVGATPGAWRRQRRA
jgi:AraC-like DNA-binding protein